MTDMIASLAVFTLEALLADQLPSQPAGFLPVLQASLLVDMTVSTAVFWLDALLADRLPEQPAGFLPVLKAGLLV